MKYFICLVAIITFCLSMSVAEAQNNVVVVPLGGAVGDAVPRDVVKGKIFSSDAGKGLTGTLELPTDGAVGDAVPSDVVKGKTFSSEAGIGLTGTLLIPKNSEQKGAIFLRIC
jgi:hypothetical protein